jgi:hypothetical protein
MVQLDLLLCFHCTFLLVLCFILYRFYVLSNVRELVIPRFVMNLHLFIIDEFVCFIDFFQFSNKYLFKWYSKSSKGGMTCDFKGEVYNS